MKQNNSSGKKIRKRKVWFFLLLISLIGCFFVYTKVGYFKMVSVNMEPIIPKGSIARINFFYYLFNDPQRGDIVVYSDPKISNDMWLISRIAATGGETITLKDSKLYDEKGKVTKPEIFNLLEYEGVADSYLIEGKKVRIPEKHYFLLGDNTFNSRDSRYVGFISENCIIGKVSIKGKNEADLFLNRTVASKIIEQNKHTFKKIEEKRIKFPRETKENITEK